MPSTLTASEVTAMAPGRGTGADFRDTSKSEIAPIDLEHIRAEPFHGTLVVVRPVIFGIANSVWLKIYKVITLIYFTVGVRAKSRVELRSKVVFPQRDLALRNLVKFAA